MTDDQEEALAMSDRIAVMQQGKLIESRTPQSLCDHPQEAFTASFLGARTVIAGRSRDSVFEAEGLSCAEAPADAKAIILRAARLWISATPHGPLRLDGVVTSAIYLADDYEVEVDTLAEEWVNLHLSAPCMLAYAQQIYYSPTVKNLPIPADLQPKLVLGPDVAKLVDFDWDVVIRNQPAWTSRFNREIAG